MSTNPFNITAVEARTRLEAVRAPARREIDDLIRKEVIPDIELQIEEGRDHCFVCYEGWTLYKMKYFKRQAKAANYKVQYVDHNNKHCLKVSW